MSIKQYKLIEQINKKEKLNRLEYLVLRNNYE